MGAYKSDNKFIAIDSLFYPDFIIPKKEEITRASESFPFQLDDTVLDENKVWQPYIDEIKKASIDKKVYFKAILGNVTTFSGSSVSLYNGTTILTILEDGTFDW